MKLGEIYDLIIMRLNVDFDDPAFWQPYEIFAHMKRAINAIIESTDLVLAERTLQLVPRIDNGKFVEGFYSIPNTISNKNFEVASITAIYWRVVTGNRIEDRKMDIMRPFELDQIDSTWKNRVCRKGEYPTHAVMYNGNLTDFGDLSDTLVDGYDVTRWGVPKIKLYPSPAITDEMYNSIEDYTALVNEFNASGDTIGVGRANEGDVTDTVNNLTDENDNIISVSPGQPNLSLITRMENIITEDLRGILPHCLYKPMFDVSFSEYDDSWKNLNVNFIPQKEQYSIVDFVVAEAYKKEGQTQDFTKSAINKREFEKVNNESRSKNKVYTNDRARRNVFFP